MTRGAAAVMQSSFLFMLKNIKNNRYQICKQKKAISLQHQNNWGRSKVGRMLADLRTKRGLTQRQLAERTGLSYGNIGKLEAGKYNVSVDILYKMLDALDAELVIKEKAAE